MDTDAVGCSGTMQDTRQILPTLPEVLFGLKSVPPDTRAQVENVLLQYPTICTVTLHLSFKATCRGVLAKLLQVGKCAVVV